LPQVLIVDDDPELLAVCRVGLQALGHIVHTAETGRDGLAETAVRRPEVIVLDLGLPDMDGVDVCRRIRAWSTTPIVVLSADSTEDRKVEALEAGADDYVTKPFGMRELSARLRVALRHHAAADAGHGGTELTVGPLHLDLVHYHASVGGRAVDLTAREFEFLAFLARHAGKVCTRRMILENVWGPGYGAELSYLKVYAYRIRRKLGDEDGRILQSDPSVGYRLADPSGG
jgi:two-component system, OmpR family, KDP operon response regulator KdpE